MRCSSASTPETLSRREETFPSRFLQCFQWLIHAKSFYNCASGQGLGPVARAFHTPGGRLAGNFTALQPHFLAASLRKPCSFLQDGRQSPGHVLAASLRKPCSFLQDGRQSPGHVRLDLPPAHLAIDALQLGEHARNVVARNAKIAGTAWRSAATASCSLLPVKNASGLITSPSARCWTRVAKTMSKSLSVLACRTWSLSPSAPAARSASLDAISA